MTSSSRPRVDGATSPLDHPLAPATPRVAVAILVAVVALALYGWTLAPTATLIDSGELIAAAHEPGIAHPPGFPLYVLLAHAATRIPIGNVAERVNFVSALFAALAAGMLTLAIDEVILGEALRRHRDEGRGRRPARSRRSRARSSGDTVAEAASAVGPVVSLAPGLVGGLLLACSATLWAYATIAEVYALNTLLLVIVCYLVLRWRRTSLASGPTDRPLVLAGFVFGLALGVHHVTVALMFPALATLVLVTDGGGRRPWARVLAVSLAIAAGAAIYLYLPLAARHSPLINWGDPRTFERFWWHVTGRQYQGFFELSLASVFREANQLVMFLAREFGPWWLPVGLLVSGTGWYAMLRAKSPLLWFSLLAVGTELTFGLMYEIAEDKDAYYLPMFVVLVIAAGLGADFLIRRARVLRLAPAVVAILLFAAPLVALAANFPFNDRRRYFVAEDYADNVLASMAPHGLLLTGDWQVYSPLMYFHTLERRRPDALVIDIHQLRRSWYYAYLRRAYPDLMTKNRDAVTPFVEDLERWEHDPDRYRRSPADTRRINSRFYTMILGFIARHLETAPVYLTQDLVTSMSHGDAELTRAVGATYQVIPHGLLFELVVSREFRDSADPLLKTRGLFDGPLRLREDDVARLKVAPVYVGMLTNRGRYLAAHGRHDRALAYFDQSLQLDSRYVPAQQALRASLNATRALSPR
jgi:hypothetical protein